MCSFVLVSLVSLLVELPRIFDSRFWPPCASNIHSWRCVITMLTLTKFQLLWCRLCLAVSRQRVNLLEFSVYGGGIQSRI